jgi:NAD(P)-dependent dehydrogenase (short-subunit alcohol dehydrogenase family)
MPIAPQPPSAPERLFDLAGARVLVTGGTGGIGAALVEGFLRIGRPMALRQASAERGGS